jgi:hypothetical protein
MKKQSEKELREAIWRNFLKESAMFALKDKWEPSDEQVQEMFEGTWLPMGIRRYNEACIDLACFLNATDYSLDKLKIPMPATYHSYKAYCEDTKQSYYRTVFSVSHEGVKRFFMILALENGEYDLSGFKFDPPDEVTYDNMGSFYRDFLSVRLDDPHAAAAYIAVVFGVNPDAVNVEYIEPVIPVVVHKMTGFPIYRFNVEGKKYLAMVEEHSTENTDYVVRITSNNEEAKMLTFDGAKKGRLYKTVLLKRLNDYFKETFGKRYQFSWGPNVEMK